MSHKHIFVRVSRGVFACDDCLEAPPDAELIESLRQELDGMADALEKLAKAIADDDNRERPALNEAINRAWELVE